MLGCSDCDIVTDPAVLRPRQERPGEEIANSVSHGVGLLAILAGIPALIADALRHGAPETVAGAAVFAATLVLLYATSTLYHALPRGRGKHVLRRVEHSLIY